MIISTKKKTNCSEKQRESKILSFDQKRNEMKVI